MNTFRNLEDNMGRSSDRTDDARMRQDAYEKGRSPMSIDELDTLVAKYRNEKMAGIISFATETRHAA